MAKMTRIGAPLDLADNSEFTDLRRASALGGLLELLESAPPETMLRAEGLAALLGAVIDEG